MKSLCHELKVLNARQIRYSRFDTSMLGFLMWINNASVNYQYCNSSLKMFGAMHFIYYINRTIATKEDSTYLAY